MSERVRFITHRGKQILSIDFSHLSAEDFLREMAEARTLIGKQPPASVLTLTNVESAHFNPRVSEAIKEYVAHNKPFVKAGVVLGLDGLKTIIFNFVNRVSGRSLKAMDDLERAKDWLANA